MANAYAEWMSQMPGTGGMEWASGSLLSDPSLAYYSAPYSPTATPSAASRFMGASPSRSRYFEQSMPQVYNAFQGQVGAALRGGTTPPTFLDFLETDPWTSRYAALPQRMRGATGMMANPRTRFLYNF